MAKAKTATKPLDVKSKATESEPKTEKYQVIKPCRLHGKYRAVGYKADLTAPQAFLFLHQKKIEKVSK